MNGGVCIHWRQPTGSGDLCWDQLRCLYAYWSRNGELLYVGKAWAKTVRERWHRSAKTHFWDDLESGRGIFEHSVTVGTIELRPPQRLTSHLLTDAESLLIFRNQPWGNIQCRTTRIMRAGLTVSCRGDWFSRRHVFTDDG